MQTLNNAHLHIGYEGYVSWSLENHTPANVLDHLKRGAFLRSGTAMAMGDQPVDFALEFRKHQLAGAYPAAIRYANVLGEASVLALSGRERDFIRVAHASFFHRPHF
jgi:hypothetical protein